MHSDMIDQADTPFISVVIAVYNGSGTIEKTLQSLKAQDYPAKRREVIVVDDGSRDGTAAIARCYATTVIEHPANLGLSRARVTGMKAATGSIIINIDADIIIHPDALSRIVRYFSTHADVAALTGRLSKEHPHEGFFSQYKNLYMHYIFGLLPEQISFLYGSLHAVRREAAELYRPLIDIGEDTLFGQTVVSAGMKIAFLKDLEFIHLKRYDAVSFIRNDFLVPFNWAKIFVRYGGWKQIGKDRSGFSHAPKKQLASIATVALMFLTAGVAFAHPGAWKIFLFLWCVWVTLNMHFLIFLARERGVRFSALAFFITMLDNSIMGIGIASGFLSTFGTGTKERSA